MQIGERSQDRNENMTQDSFEELGFDPENRRPGEVHGNMFLCMLQYLFQTLLQKQQQSITLYLHWGKDEQKWT